MVSVGWKKSLIGDLATFSKGAGYSKKDLRVSGTPIVLYGRLYTNYELVIHKVNSYVEDKGGSIYSRGGEVVVPASGETAEDISRASVIAKPGVIIGGDLNVIYPNNAIIPELLALLISNGTAKKRLSIKAQGKTVVHVQKNDLAGLEITYPEDPKEQERIVEAFSNIDTLIFQSEKLVEKYQEMKQGLLQLLFPHAGQTKPEKSLSGFDKPWEEHRLGEIGNAKSGIGFPDSEQGGTVGIPFFKVSDMNTYGNENELLVANNYVTEAQISRNRWNVIEDVPAVFFAKVGAAVLLNRKRLVRRPFLLDNNTMAYVFDKKTWDCDFGKTLFETIDLTKLTQIGALPSYNATDVEGLNVCIPEKAEQEVIGQFFMLLDNLIMRQQKKCEKYKMVKQGMVEELLTGKVRLV